MRAILDTGLAHGGGRPTAVPFWTDAALFSAAGTEAAVLGPAGSGAHSDEKWVELESVSALATLLARASRDYLNPSAMTNASREGEA